MRICYTTQGVQNGALCQSKRVGWGRGWEGGSRGKWHM